MKSRKIWYNGEILDESEARISVYDSALMFGDMVFEMTRSFNKKQFKLREHLERLYASIEYLEIPVELTIDEMEKAVYEIIEVNDNSFNDDDEHRVMIDVSRGLLSIYQDTVGGHKGANVIITVFPLKWTVQGMGELFTSGINAVVPSQRTIPASLLEPKVKNRSRIHYLMANIEVSKYEGENNWALLLDPDGYIAEGTGDNFFIVKDSVIITPESRNILRGISREYIFELAESLNIKCVEKNIELYDVINADEAFMTGTPFSLLPVTSINKHSINKAKVGKIYSLLLDKWSKNVNLNIKEQIIIWDAEREGVNFGPSPYSFKQGKQK